MAQNIQFDSEIVPVYSLDLFDKEKLTFSVVDSSEFRQLPSLPYDNQSQIVFDVTGLQTAFLSPNFYIDVIIKVHKKVKGADGKVTEQQIAAADKITLDSHPLHSLFSSIDVSMNDVLITNKNDRYPYLAYLDRTHLTDSDTYIIHSGLECGTIPEGGATNSVDGVVQKERLSDISGDQELFLRGKLVCPIFQQQKYILPSVNVRITLHQTHSAFRLMCSDSSMDAVVTIEKISLIGHRLIPNAQLFVDIMEELKRTPARYPITRFEPQTFEISQGATMGEKMLSLPSYKVPRMVFVTTFDTNAFFGEKTKGAFRAKCSMIKEAYIQIEDQRFPTIPYDGTTGEGMRKMFGDYKQNTKILMGGRDNFIDYVRYRQDFTIMSFNLDRFHGTERSKEDAQAQAQTMSRVGSCSLHIKLSSAAVTPVTVFVVLVYNDTITFNEALVPHTNY